MTILARRKGKTVSEWQTVQDCHLRPPKWMSVQIEMEFASKGGGTTDVLVEIFPASFETITKQMMQINPDAAMKAFGAALQEGVPKKKTTSGT